MSPCGRPLDTLSRLKGIETITAMSAIVSAKNKTLDTLSRLKGIETHFNLSIEDWVWKTLDTLSRLKGIETF